MVKKRWTNSDECFLKQNVNADLDFLMERLNRSQRGICQRIIKLNMKRKHKTGQIPWRSCHMKTNFNREEWTIYFENKLEGGTA